MKRILMIGLPTKPSALAATAIAALLSLSSSAHAVVLFAGAFSNEFVSIETSPLAETLINGNVQSTEGSEQLAGLDFQPSTNILFGSTGGESQSASPGTLFTVDPGTGNLTLVGEINGRRVVSLAFRANGDLFGSDQQNLLGINPNDGTFTIEGSFGLSENRIAGMAFSPLDGLLYAATYFTGELGTIDLVSGAFSSLGVLTEAGGSAQDADRLAGMTFDQAGNLFAAKGDANGDMFLLDVANVEYTFLGNTHDESITSLATIRSVPEPTTLLLMGLGLAGLGFARKRLH